MNLYLYILSCYIYNKNSIYVILTYLQLTIKKKSRKVHGFRLQMDTTTVKIMADMPNQIMPRGINGPRLHTTRATNCTTPVKIITCTILRNTRYAMYQFVSMPFMLENTESPTHLKMLCLQWLGSNYWDKRKREKNC